MKHIDKKSHIILFFFAFLLLSYQPIWAQFKSNSVLATGNWFKIAVDSSGVYKIDKSFLESIGINTTTLDPSTIRIYGNGGGMVPQPNNAPRVDDLQELAIKVIGSEDKKFDANDYILFYAQGPHVWKRDATPPYFHHEINLYTDVACYFINIGGIELGLRMTNQNAASDSIGAIQYYNEHLYYEKDEFNLINSGREWFGNLYTKNTPTNKQFNFNISGIKKKSAITLVSSVMSASPVSTSFSLSENSNPIKTFNFASYPQSQFIYGSKGDWQTYTTTLIPSSSQLTLDLTYNHNNDNDSKGFLNFFEVYFERELGYYQNPTFIQLANSGQNVTKYYLKNVPNKCQLWDITNLNTCSILNYSILNQGIAFLSQSNNEYIIFDSTQVPTPKFISKINNQNLHGMNVPNMVLLTHPSLINEAKKIATLRNQKSQISVSVATTEDVYNEFSSGVQDISAIRDFMRMLYSKDASHSTLKHLFILGDACYDYKNRIANNRHLVPNYQARESLHNVNTYSSDDYFGLLDSTEGEWAENYTDNNTLEIGIGRIPVATSAEAETYYQKLMNYESDSSNGIWKNKITFIADDGDANLHFNQVEYISETFKTNFPKYNIDKIYVDAFIELPRPPNEEYFQPAPVCSTLIKQNIINGTNILSYTGHAGYERWAAENLIYYTDFKDLISKYRLPFIITFGCEYVTYDNPYIEGASSDYILFKANLNGGIGIISATKPAYSSANFELSQLFYKYITEQTQGTFKSIGEVFRLTKNNARSSIGKLNNRNYSLLCDPSLLVFKNSLNISIDQLDNVNIHPQDTLEPKQTYTIDGSIRNLDQTIHVNFNGEIELMVLDQIDTLHTLGNLLNGDNNIAAPFKQQDNILFKGKATVTNGKFSFSFLLPPNNHNWTNTGKINMYAYNSTESANGTQEILVGVKNSSTTLDITPPSVNLYIDKLTFKNGDTTLPKTSLIAILKDTSGINTSNKENSLIAYLDDSLLFLNQFYSTDINTYKSGILQYPFSNLSIGNHVIKFIALDNYNNKDSSIIDFTVTQSLDSSVTGIVKEIVSSGYNIIAYPNPASSNESVHWTQQNIGENNAYIRSIEIFTTQGNCLQTITDIQLEINGEIKWGNKTDLPSGVYIYKISIQENGTKKTKEKIIVIQ